jgi:antitoxin HicB
MSDEIDGGEGSSLESWLDEVGRLEEATAVAIKSVIAWQLADEMKSRKISKTKMAEMLQTSRTQVDRILDPSNVAVSFEMMSRAAKAVGRRLRLELV